MNNNIKFIHEFDREENLSKPNCLNGFTVGYRFVGDTKIEFSIALCRDQYVKKIGREKVTERLNTSPCYLDQQFLALAAASFFTSKSNVFDINEYVCNLNYGQLLTPPDMMKMMYDHLESKSVKSYSHDFIKDVFRMLAVMVIDTKKYENLSVITQNAVECMRYEFGGIVEMAELPTSNRKN